MSRTTGLLKIGAVSYLNTKPLVHQLDELLPDAQLYFDLPSRLADRLAVGELDIALIPAVEFFRGSNYSIVSDACIAARGPVWSVRVLFRTPPAKVKRMALDVGSRTSATLARILLSERFGVYPELLPLPMNLHWHDCDADAMVVIGDRAMHIDTSEFLETWDVAEEWIDWTGLPGVFAMWVARDGIDVSEVSWALSEARDRGCRDAELIARREASTYDLSYDQCLRYFRENLHFNLGEQERAGLERFYQSAVSMGLAPSGKQPFRYLVAT